MTNPVAAEVIDAVRSAPGGGVREFVVCGGARNAALVAELGTRAAAGEGGGGVRVFHHFDERSAGFFAVGRAIAGGRPVAVVTTSGTAAAELLPAAIEAHYQGVPLVLVTADRPAHFRRSGAPQAIEQAHLFSGFAPMIRDVRSGGDCGGLFAGWDGCSPVHVNVALPEPGVLEPGGDHGVADAAVRAADGMAFPPPGGRRVPPDRLHSFLAGAERLLVMVGALPPAAADEVGRFVRMVGAPVWAEAISQLRGSDVLGGLLVRGGERSLAAGGFTDVLRIGGVPSCRFWRDLEAAPGVRVLSVTASGYPGLARDSERMKFPDAWPATVPSRCVAGVMDWGRDEAEARRIGRVLAMHPDSEPGMIRRLSMLVPSGAAVFLGNSLPIREWNAFAETAVRGRRTFACRGANGIDGQVSAFLGTADGAAEAWGVFGDLTALCDLGAPWIEPQLAPGRRRLVVVNNHGGRIFERLPALRAMDARSRRLLTNPHSIEFRALADLWGWEFRQVGSEADWASLEDAPDAERLVIELRPDGTSSEAVWAALAEGAGDEEGASR